MSNFDIKTPVADTGKTTAMVGDIEFIRSEEDWCAILKALVNEFYNGYYYVNLKGYQTISITEDYEDDCQIEILVNINTDTHCVSVRGLKDDVVFGEREFTWRLWVNQDDIDRTIDMVKSAFEGIHNYMAGIHTEKLNALREQFNNDQTEWMRECFKAYVEYNIEKTDDFTPEKMVRCNEWRFRRNTSWVWDSCILTYAPELIWEAKAFYTFNDFGFFQNDWVPRMFIREWAWENQVDYETVSWENAEGFDEEDIYVRGHIDLCHNMVHRIAYLICQTVHNCIEKKRQIKIVIDKDFFGEDDFKFLSDDHNFISIELFIFKYSKFIVGEDIRSVDVDENGVVVRLFNNYVNVGVK